MPGRAGEGWRGQELGQGAPSTEPRPWAVCRSKGAGGLATARVKSLQGPARISSPSRRNMKCACTQIYAPGMFITALFLITKNWHQHTSSQREIDEVMTEHRAPECHVALRGQVCEECSLV